ncbi:hypothetical protein Hanom_Chr00s055014g01782311 [Helianthus anomalus]
MDLCSIAAAKDKKIAQLEKEKANLDEQLMIAEVGIHEAQVNATEDAKVYATRTLGHDQDGWKLALLNLGGEADVDQVLTLEAGTSGAKEQNDDVVDAAGGDVVALGDKGC